jgi:hypothetical protein
MYIYDGNLIINLCQDIDDYGSLPELFTPTEDNVPLDYWD